MVLTKENRPISRLPHLAGFPYKSHFIIINNIKVYYVDEGPIESIPILLIHGVPTWSYLFRKIIPGLLQKGYRVIAPDLPGFGRSDKPSNKDYYTLARLTNVLVNIVIKLKLKNIVLFGHDWGGILSMSLASENPDKFSGLILSNGYLPRGNEKPPFLFKLWKFITKYSFILPIGKIISYGCDRNITKSDYNAYNLPFINNRNKVAVRVLPQLLLSKSEKDISISMNIWMRMEKWNKPLLTLFSDNDPITAGGDKILQKYIPGSKNQNHKVLKGGHFIPEDAPEELTESIILFIQKL